MVSAAEVMAVLTGYNANKQQKKISLKCEEHRLLDCGALWSGRQLRDYEGKGIETCESLQSKKRKQFCIRTSISKLKHVTKKLSQTVNMG